MSASGRAAAGRERGAIRERPNEMVALVTRLVLTQAGLSAAIGLSYSRRNGPWLVITLTLAIALLGLAVVVRSGGHPAWILAVGFEAAFIAFGLVRFFTARYLGGTLFALVTLGVLVHPAATRAFGGPSRRRDQGLGRARLADLGEAADDALGGRAAG